jgi:predicted RNA-binding Zn-ribbon protein involved in translation (DUF1610 family)
VVSVVGKFKVDLVCTSCSKNIGRAWVMEYEGYHFTRVIYLCPNCGAVIKVARKKPWVSEVVPMALLRGAQ